MNVSFGAKYPEVLRTDFRHAVAIRQTVGRLTPQAHISVIRIESSEDSVHHRHVDRHKDLIIIAIVVGILGAFIGAAASAK